LDSPIFTFKYFNSEGNICQIPIRNKTLFKSALFSMPLLDLDKVNTSFDISILKSTLQRNLKENDEYLRFMTNMGLFHDGLMWFE